MKQEFIIEGMTCDNCKKKVTASLASLEGVADVTVDRESGLAHLEAERILSKMELEKALGAKYAIVTKAVNQPSSKLKALYPLFLILIYYRGFPSSFANYDPLARQVRVYGKIYPFIETFLGVAFLLRYQLDAALWITVVLLSITTIGVVQSLVNKRQIECACLGTVLKLPMTEATLIENSLMLVMAGGLIFG